MDCIYLIEYYDYDTNSIMGAFDNGIDAINEAKYWAENLKKAITQEEKDQTNIEYRLTHEGYFVKKMIKNEIYEHVEIIFDSADYLYPNS